MLEYIIDIYIYILYIQWRNYIVNVANQGPSLPLKVAVVVFV